MLANKEYQTPNAIDPGEAPPSRPSRRFGGASSVSAFGAENGDDSSASPSINDVRMNATRLLQRVESSSPSSSPPRHRSVFPYNAADIRDDEISLGNVDYDEETNEPRNNHHSLPTVEEARLYAGRILSAKSARDLSPESAERARLTSYTETKQQVSIGKGSTVPLIVPPHIKAARSRFWKRCALLTVILGIVATIIGLAVKVSQQQPKSSSSSTANTTPTTSSTTSTGTTPQGDSSKFTDSPRLVRIYEFLEFHDISKTKDFRDPGTAQNLASIWMANHDALALEIPLPASEPQMLTSFIQRYVLAVFYFALNGPLWDSQLFFLDKIHECSWYERDPLVDGEVVAVGITCDMFGDSLEVTEILMPRNKLAGSLPTELAHLTKLNFIDLNRNALEGTIPNEYESLSNMRFFDVRYNQVTGTIPQWIGQKWERLAEFAVSDNQMEGSLPNSISELVDLKSLSLANNRFNQSLEALTALVSLEFIYLENNTFTGEVNDSFLQNMNNLIQVDISSNELTSSEFPVHLLQHPKMQVLDLGDNNLMGALPNDMQTGNTALQYLALNDNVLSGSIPATISQLVNLNHIDLTGNALSNTIPASLSGMTKLTYVFLSQNDFLEGPVPELFSSMTQIRELSLSNTQRTGTIPEQWIGKMSNLVLLDLSYNRMTGTLPPVLWELPQISYLLLNRNNFTGNVPPGISDASELDLFLLDKNSVTGDLSEACTVHQKQHYIVDCEEIVCDCCQCCSDYDLRCNDDILYTNQDFTFENNYTRTSYAFSPQILFEEAWKPLL